MRSPFLSLRRDELRDLITGAGFQDVRIFLGIGPVRYPTVEEFLRWEGASSPLAGPIGALKDDVRAALIHDLGEALRRRALVGTMWPDLASGRESRYN